MKVCTDSCVFGAWTARKIEEKSPANILDIGTGTGLLSLMAAQKTSAVIHAIDIDNDAAIQAKENFDLSPWSQRLQVFNGDIKNWTGAGQYDCIISNPPFYEDDLLPEKEGKQISKHSNNLNLKELIKAVDRLLTNDGIFGIILPYARAEYFEKEALKLSFFTSERLNLKQSMKHGYFRTILILKRKQSPLIVTEISIRDNGNEYTLEFMELLKDYYLFL